MVTYEQIQHDPNIRVYIRQADDMMHALGYTEHSFAHVTRCAVKSGELLLQLGYSPREAELARIAGYLHDIGNVINRVDHAQSGAVMAFRLLDQLGMPAEEIAVVVSAIGNHDEGTAFPVNAVAAALILADKSDVRRSRVHNPDPGTFDIHDRVNYAAERSSLELTEDHSAVVLDLTIDTSISAVMDYFEIFLQRMLLCRRAADKLGIRFRLVINGQNIL